MEAAATVQEGMGLGRVAWWGESRAGAGEEYGGKRGRLLVSHEEGSRG